MDDKKYLKLVGERIREFRKPVITQEDLAEKIGAKHTQIGRIERGEANCTLTTLKKIVDVLRVPVCKLIEIDENVKRK